MYLALTAELYRWQKTYSPVHQVLHLMLYTKVHIPNTFKSKDMSKGPFLQMQALMALVSLIRILLGFTVSLIRRPK